MELSSAADGAAANLLMECDEEEQSVWPSSPQRHEEEEEEGHDEALAAAVGPLEKEELDLRPVKIVPIPVQPVGGCSPPTQNNPMQSPGVPLGFKVNGRLVCLLPGGGPAELKLCSHPGGSASGFTTVQIHSPAAPHHIHTTGPLTAAEADSTPIITGVVSGEAAQKVLSVHSVTSESISPPRAPPVPVSVPSPWKLVPLQTTPPPVAPKKPKPKPTAPHPKLLHRGQLGPVSPPDCSVCLSQYKLITELRGFMCLCSPTIALSLKNLKKKNKKKKKKKKKHSRRSGDKHKKSKSPGDPETSGIGSRPRPGPPASKVTSPVQRPYRPPDHFLSDRLSPAPVPPLSSGSSSPPPEPARPGSPPGTEPRPGKLVIMVEDFYYGSAPGRPVARHTQPDRRFTGPFRCINCPRSLGNNTRLMSHMKQHVSSTLGGDVSVCPHCYRHFLSPFKLQCHVEAVHSQYQSTAKCRICELDFGSEAAFLWHMKSTHTPGEMPYVCQVCDFRSSFYSDVWSHFHQFHADSKHLMCQYCLRVMRSNASYQQHFARHQKKHVFGCEKCRLHFLFTK
ncbi:hypothetical protein EPR50_G00144240 [Perca flavescens]|uniref:C2H2-type domain-containing protein n=1 Tax=Perca flavescens TaxID=8167 RepID=A0A484CJR1_PERFV|nr:hypothetical protein EPR50_G00144240 [Perca flavescens]